jgi:hypothetical protein
MSFPADEEAQFIKNDLGPALTQARINAKLLAYDYPWVNLDYPVTLFDDPSSSVSFKVRRSDGQSFPYTLAAGGIASLVWNEG